MSVYKPKGAEHYVYDFQHRGRRFCGTTGSASRREAEAFERARRAEAAEEVKRHIALGRAPLTFELASSRYWNEVGQHHVRSDDTLWALGWLQKQIGPRTRIIDITDDDVSALVTKRRAEGVKPATVNRTMTEPLRKILRRAAIMWGEKDMPVIRWKEHLLAEPRERVRELRPDEEAKLFANVRPDYHPILRFALITGCRLMECFGLTWSDVDWGGRLVWITGKSGKRAPIPLSPSVRAALWPLQGHHLEAVFTYVAARGTRQVRKGERRPITREGLKSEWRRAKADAGILDYRFHDNRHTAATRILRATGNLKVVQRVLRHENIQTTMRYAHLSDDDAMAGMEAAAQSAAAMTPGPVESPVSRRERRAKSKR